MNIPISTGRRRGFTKLEMLVVVVVVALIATFIIPAFSNAKNKAQRIRCVSYHKQITLAFRMWSHDNSENFPFMHSTNTGGSKEYIGTDESFRHFLCASNELGTPFILTCLNDNRKSVKDWSKFNQTNLSYFVNIDSRESNPNSILIGDRNLTNLQSAGKGLWQLATNPATQWTDEIHRGQGNVGFADGSVQQASSSGLLKHIQTDTNTLRRIELP